ncbi:MAG: hypothetical protein AAGF29_01850 [Pseudomonadota bacterium]
MDHQHSHQPSARTAAGHARRWLAVGSLGFFVACLPAAASGSSYMTIGLPDKEKAVTAIGVAPEKETIELNLGGLRTGEAQLPGGSTTLRERMEMRARLREKRQMAVTMATREPVSTDNGDQQSLPVSADGGTQFDLPPKASEKRVDDGYEQIEMQELGM